MDVASDVEVAGSIPGVGRRVIQSARAKRRRAGYAANDQGLPIGEYRQAAKASRGCHHGRVASRAHAIGGGIIELGVCVARSDQYLAACQSSIKVTVTALKQIGPRCPDIGHRVIQIGGIEYGVRRGYPAGNEDAAIVEYGCGVIVPANRHCGHRGPAVGDGIVTIHGIERAVVCAADGEH